MRWQRLAIYLVFLGSWGIFAGWQYRAYRHETDLIQETLHQQAHAVMNALIGGFRSHRRLGRYFEQQMLGVLDELTKSENVLAAAILSTDGELLLSAGQADLLGHPTTITTGDHLAASGFRLVEAVEISPPAPPTAGSAGGRGGGWGRLIDYEETEGPFAEGGVFQAALLMDRSRFDHLTRRSRRSHTFVTIAAGLVFLALGFAWRASVQLIEAQGRAKVLETEARHLRELNQAAAGLAHETRNPLSLIRGWTQRLAQEGMDEEERKRHADTLIEECDRIAARINQFLAFARPCDPDRGTVDVADLVNELGIILEPDLESKDLQIACEPAPQELIIQADRELLRQALFNLIQNAIYFSPVGESVTIEGHDDGSRSISLRVLDRGPGVPESSVDDLFTPYFTTRAEGTGLGLAIVKRIATAHGWHCAYQSRAGGGSVFSLEGIHG